MRHDENRRSVHDSTLLHVLPAKDPDLVLLEEGAADVAIQGVGEVVPEALQPVERCKIYMGFMLGDIDK